MKEFIEEFSNWPVWAILIVSMPFAISLGFIIWVSFTHFHCYSKPIVSMYCCFNSRNIIYECKCGKRRADYVTRRFGDPYDPFPMETTLFIDYKEFNEILNGADPEKVLGYRFKRS